MAELRSPNIAGNFQSGYAFGTQMKQQRQAEQDQQELRALAPQILSGDPSALAQGAAINPEAAGQYDKVGVDIAKRGAGAAAHILDAVKRGNPREIEGRYQAVIPFLTKLGAQQGKVPPPQFDPAMIPAMEQLVAMGQGATAQGRVQSTYIDAQGNRVAIMADGSTQVLGQNAPNNQIIDTGQGFYGVNKGNLQAAPVMVGVQQPAPQHQPQPGTRTISDFQAIDESTGQPITDPAELAAIQASIPQLSGEQLRSGPKPQAAPSGYRYLPDGTLDIIPGGPAQVAADARADAAAARKAAEDAKAEQKRQGALARQVEAATAANQLVAAIDGLTKHPGFESLGTAWGDIQTNTPIVRNDAKDARARLKNIAGQVALSTMARLKSLSATGATGFGSLTAPELNLLQNSIDTLESENISNEQLVSSLNNIRDFMDKTANWNPQQADTPSTGGWSIRAIE